MRHSIRSALARRWLRPACLALLLAAGGAQAGPPPWPDAPYSYFAEGAKLEAVLSEFAAGFSLTLDLHPAVTGSVNGRFTAKNPTEFVSRLGGVYGFAWYTHGGILHVSPANESTMKAVPLPLGGVNLRAALIELGVVEPRFGWAELPNQRVVMVSGPPSYIALVERTLRQLPGSSSIQEVRLFRLKYASAEDRTISYRDGSILQPGLASVLRQLLGGRGAVGTGILGEFARPSGQGPGQAGPGSGAAPLPPGQQPPAPGAPALPALGGALGAGGASGAPAAGPGALASGGGGQLQVSADPRFRIPSIQSDPRLNALIVQDEPERMPVYERLIAQLDVPSPLIEIEAMIIDVNSERARELGINWSLSSSNGNSLSFGVPGSLGGVGTLSFAGSSSALGASAGAQLLTQLRALENHGDATIQSRPSVLTIDNLGALLDLSETFYIRVQGERVASVSPITAGTTLKVTPRLIDGAAPAIQLTIDIEDGQIQDRQVDSLPTVRRSSVSTQAIVRQGDTLVIAGYATDQNVETLQKVPVLGDIPGVGLLFSNKLRTSQKRERLFMIRPKLVGLPFVTPEPVK
ncbi:MAG: type III secretion system outer membrane ring subunit SctC [Pseudomonadota bacterium]